MDVDDEPLARFSFETRIIEWRGPSPFFYAPIPAQYIDELRQLTRIVSYGWGVTPVEALIGDIAFKTSLFPKARRLSPATESRREAAGQYYRRRCDRVELTVQPPKGI
ncbi:MAG: DUF1905 domain-containing protein [Caulobacteraceae bacterium]